MRYSPRSLVTTPTCGTCNEGLVATSPSLQVPQVGVVTNERGEYRITPLPLGTYAVEYTLEGFQSIRRTELRITAGFTAKVDVVLKVSTLAGDRNRLGERPHVEDTAHPG